MKYIEAANQINALLRDEPDDLVAGGAMYLACEAWKQLAGSDIAWDRFGLELLDVRARHYSDHQDVTVDAEGPVRDDAETRLAVTDMVEQLARYHQRCAVDGRLGLAGRLSHDAAAQQLRRAAAALG
ncbi:hypothetical protein [Micromonospora globbae]|uniref:Uncharacterized protein n=1 Tax=Micromonospora globbae TaxID=1894969 RepID=A0A420EVC3_9ACTN|nr:hypothetical protein [Micromonospora globbae]RKF24671.1 hypothetical protein D7I43_25165 [Micromonospora globbae]